MSGSTGADRVSSREHFKQFLASYKKIISKFPGFVSFTPSGSYNSDATKNSFGDIDLIVHIQSDKTKPEVKKDLAAFFEKLPHDVIVPFSSEKHAGKRTNNTGEIITIRYHDKKLGYSAQVDNMIALTHDEANFKQEFLDLPAEKQGLVLGLVKVATVEETPAVIFKRMGIHVNEKLAKDQALEFNLSGVELQLRKLTYEPGTFKEKDREILWRSQKFSDVEKLLHKYDLALTFDQFMNKIEHTLTTKRSRIRMSGVFSSMISVKSGEQGTDKGAAKTKAIQAVVDRFLTESEGKKAVVLFGRFQPPTIGHEIIVNHAKAIAKAGGAKVILFTGRTQHKKKDPIAYSDKIDILRKLFGNIVFNDKQSVCRTPFEALTYLSNNGYSEVVFVVGSDRVEEFKTKITPYLNTGKDTSINLSKFTVISGGERDPDAEDSSGVSGTKMREFVKEDKFEEFANGLPSLVTPALAKHIWEIIRKGMNESDIASYTKFKWLINTY